MGNNDDVGIYQFFYKYWTKILLWGINGLSLPGLPVFLNEALSDPLRLRTRAGATFMMAVAVGVRDSFY